MRTRTILAASAALVLTASVAQAQEAMSTAGATGVAPSEINLAAAEPAAPAAAAPKTETLDTAEQIRRWLADSPAATTPEEAYGEGVRLPRDRQIHGEVGVAVGTGGYRSGYITSVMPIGETGTLALTIGQEKNGYRHYWNGRPYGVFDYGYSGLPH
ncbi:hypothetical protein LJR164_002319 [Phenylobacterium sp. LjRoot164]|uniref:hypothetical protein n=1 Tax=unclassified Phenylobacterium TaxID=2640670 RepID=UPI003ECEB3F4